MAVDFDAVIVGSGAGGGVMAYVLASRGWKVALLEKGRNPFPRLGTADAAGSLLGNDELRRRRSYAFHDPFIEPRTYRAGPDAPLQSGMDIQGLGVGVGGGTVQYDADSPRLQEADFRARTLYGQVEGAALVDWPYGLDELAPWYDATERLIGVQGDATADPFAAPRGPYPMPPGWPSKAGLVLARGAEKLGYHPHPMPMAVNSMFYRGRPACVSCGFCSMGCPVGAKGSTAVTAVRDALATGRCTLLPECCVTAVETEPSGTKASGVKYLDAQGKPQRLTARHVVLAANAIETPRLLLASGTGAHPDGLGNGSGLVGRHLMFHTVFIAVGVFDEEIRSYRGRPITHAMADFTTGTTSPRGGYTELGGALHPIEEGALYPWLVHASLMRSGRYRRQISTVSMIGEDMPQAGNRVELDPAVRDVYGRPVARLTYARHARDQQVIDVYMPKLSAIAKAAGAVEVLEVDAAKQNGLPATRHLLGTTRMGTDPATSVCDPWGRLHQLENVWVADGGLWPTSTGFNPTLTQQAMAYRTAGYLVDPANPRGVLS